MSAGFAGRVMGGQLEGFSSILPRIRESFNRGWGVENGALTAGFLCLQSVTSGGVM